MCIIKIDCKPFTPLLTSWMMETTAHTHIVNRESLNEMVAEIISYVGSTIPDCFFF